jgi:hypothetical protein
MKQWLRQWSSRQVCYANIIIRESKLQLTFLVLSLLAAEQWDIFELALFHLSLLESLLGLW